MLSKALFMYVIIDPLRRPMVLKFRAIKVLAACKLEIDFSLYCISVRNVKLFTLTFMVIKQLVHHS